MSAQRLRALLVDDEILARVALRQALAAHADIDVVAECGNVQEAAQAIAALSPDLLFLDIQMPGGSGFSLLRGGAVADLPLVVFTTAFAEHALQAFDVNAIDYVLKPIDQARFDQAMDRIRKHWCGLHGQGSAAPAAGAGHVKRISVQVAERTVVIAAADIDWIRADDNYVHIHAGGKTYLHRETLRHLYESLDPNYFLRIHRSIVVNLDRIREVHTLFQGHAEVVLHDGTRLDLSRRFRQAARNALRLR